MTRMRIPGTLLSLYGETQHANRFQHCSENVSGTWTAEQKKIIQEMGMKPE
jgi:hypothetical protein